MQLLIFRHGLAEDHGPDGDDASRRLTPEGIEKTAQAARGLQSIADAPQVILTSPRVRAMQTAGILGKLFGLKPIELEILAGHSPQRVVDALGERAEASVMIVGHEPTFSRVAAHLCTGGAGYDGFLELKKAGCVYLEVPVQEPGVLGRAQLIWLATPKMLRAMAIENG